MYQKVLVPVDGSAPSLEALSQAARLGSELQPSASLLVLHVGSFVPYVDVAVVVDVEKMMEEAGRVILEQAEAALHGSSLAKEFRYLSGDPAATICRIAQEESFDLIVIGNRGQGLLMELVLGSVSHKVIQHAPCPVLVVRKEKTPPKRGS